MTFPIPSDHDLREACDAAEELSYRLLRTFERQDDVDAQWAAALGHLQDVADCMGFDIVQHRQQPPATAEAYGIADYAAGRGQ